MENPKSLALRLRKILPFLGSCALATAAITISSCASDKPFNSASYIASVQNFTGYVVVASTNLPTAVGAGVVSLFSPTGDFVKVIKDYYPDGVTPTGIIPLNSYEILVLVSGAARVDRLNLRDNDSSVYLSNANITTPFGNMAISTLDNSLFIPERSVNTIEKVDSTGVRVSNPLIAATTGACTLSTPWGITYIPSVDRIAVINNVTAGRLNVYSADGTCVNSVNAAPFNVNTPAAIAYHSSSGKLITTFAGNSAIVATAIDGTSAVTIYSNTSVISTPRAIAVDSSGYLYVGSDGVDTIEKFSYAGGASAARVGTTPFISSGVYSINPSAIVVMP